MRRNATLAALLAGLVMAGSTSSAPQVERLFPHLDGSPIWSVDGTRIAFVRGTPSAWEVRAVAVTGGSTELLWSTPARPPANFLPPVALSPDWSKVAFPFSGGIRIAAIDGSGSVDISKSPQMVTWSPDSRFLSFTSYPTEIYVVRADGSGLRKVAEGYYPSWSPDGSRLAFVAFPDIAVVDRDGGGRRTIWQTTGWSGPPAWSPAGDLLAFPSDSALRVVQLDGTPLTTFNGNFVTNLGPSWSSDGTRLAIPNSPSLSVFDLRTRRHTRFPFAWSVSWAPSSDLFAHASSGPCSWPGIHVSSGSARTVRRLTLDCRIDGTRSSETLEGTEWNDVISGRGGADRIAGGGDADILIGGPGDDRIRGGPLFTDLGDTIDGGPGNDLLEGGRAEGSRGDDLLLGRSGADVLRGGPGRDIVSGGGGPDTIHARDGERDSISCGRGRDAAWIDKFDRVARDCETVRRGPA